jgi:hypothetical protein
MESYALGFLRGPALALALASVGCAAGTDASAHDEDGESEDALGARRACPALRGRACRTIEPSDVVTLASGAIHMPVGGLELAGGEFAAIGARLDDGRFVSSIVVAGRAPSSQVIPWMGVSEGTTVATADGGAALYLTAFDSARAQPSLLRARISPRGAIGGGERVTLTGATTFPEWPQAATLPDGRVLLAYRQLHTTAFLGVSDATGLRFSVRPAPITPGVLRGVLAHVGVTKRGAWVLTHQVANEQWAFTSYVQLSRDAGATFSAPRNVQPADPNVHDTSVVARLDEGADLYYVRAGSASGLSVHRRMLREDGSLGPEQLVTSAAVGHIEKPQARRLRDGRLAMTFARRVSDTVYDHALVMLHGDAPR